MKLDVQGHGGGRILDIDEQGGWGSWKLGNYHGHHVYNPLMKKTRNHRHRKQWSEKYFCFITCCHSLSLVLSLVATRCITRVSFYKRSLLFYQAQKFNKFWLFTHFEWADVKSSGCFSGISLISIILWKYCENNIKTFW